MESLLSHAFALLILFLLVGGGFLVSIVFLGVASISPNLKTRVGLVIISFFVLTTQVTCMDMASNFGGHNSTAYSNPIFGWLFIIICIWSIYLTRNSSVVILLRRGLLWIYETFVFAVKMLYNKSRMLVYKLNKDNDKRYNRMLSQSSEEKNEPQNDKR